MQIYTAIHDKTNILGYWMMTRYKLPMHERTNEQRVGYWMGIFLDLLPYFLSVSFSMFLYIRGPVLVSSW